MKESRRSCGSQSEDFHKAIFFLISSQSLCGLCGHSKACEANVL